MDATMPGEMVTRPRWRCPELGLVEHIGEREKGPEPARKRLLKRVREALGAAPGRKKNLPAVEYRAGFIPGGRPGPQS